MLKETLRLGLVFTKQEKSIEKLNLLNRGKGTRHYQWWLKANIWFHTWYDSRIWRGWLQETEAPYFIWKGDLEDGMALENSHLNER